MVLALIKEAGVSGSSATDLSAAVGEKAGKLDSAVEDARDVLDGASKCINLEPGGVTICNSIALIHPARTDATDPKARKAAGAALAELEATRVPMNTLKVGRGLQLQSLWRTPTAAVRHDCRRRGTAYSCSPCGALLLQL